MSGESATGNPKIKRVKGVSFFNYLQSELRRGYLLENDEERYAARREKVYTFFKIPWEIEKFLLYGFLQSADSFLFVMTFLPIRFMLALYCLITRPIKRYFGSGRNMTRLMKPAEIVDLLKGALMIMCCYAISYIDTSVFYHIIKTQSTIKLYFFFNMLEIADRLMSAFGQDTLDALFWTATEPRDRRREHFGILFHFIVASFYVAMHSAIVLLQALTLNVAINSDNKGLLTIVISNNFVELKGAVFKKFDRNNLLQISCSDVRERFHIIVLLFVVVIQTMKEYSWKVERLWILTPDCLMIIGTEILIDWIKHAFITRFNDIPVDAYRDYSLLIASDLVTCKQKYAYSDHSDLVARRMAFIPLPLGVVIYRVLSQSLKISNAVGVLILILGFLCLLSYRVFNGIVILGMAYDRINNAEIQRSRNASESVVNTATKVSLEVPTPSKLRKRTISRESDFSYKEINSPFVLKENKNVKSLTGSDPVLSLSCENIVSDKFQEICTSSPTEEEPSLTFLGESQSGLFANSMVNLSSVGLNRGVSDQTEAATQVTQDLSPDATSEQNFDAFTQFDQSYTEDNTENAATQIMEEDSTFLDQNSTILDQDSTILDQDSTILDQDSTILDQDSTILDQDFTILNQDSTILQEDSSTCKDDKFLKIPCDLSFTSTQSCPCFSEIEFKKNVNLEPIIPNSEKLKATEESITNLSLEKSVKETDLNM